MGDDKDGKGDRLEDHLDDRQFEAAMRRLGVGRERREVQADDDALFDAMMEVSGPPPLPGAKGARVPEGKPVARPATRRDPQLEEEDALFEAAMGASGLTGARDKGVATQTNGQPGTEEERVDGSPRTLRRRIKSGQFKAVPTLDLHGLRREAAREAVGNFLRRAVAEGHAAVRVIPGRGLHSRDSAVLREALDQWLRQDYRDFVREAVDAPIAQGGSGTVFIFLRRPGV